MSSTSAITHLSCRWCGVGVALIGASSCLRDSLLCCPCLGVLAVFRIKATLIASPDAADVTVSCVLDAYMLLLKAAGSRQQRLRRLAMRCGMHAVRAVVVLVAVTTYSPVAASCSTEVTSRLKRRESSFAAAQRQ